MAKYYIKHNGETFIPVPYDTKEKAAMTLIEAIATAVKFGNNDPTKFTIEEVDEPEAPTDVPDLIPDYEAACDYLERYCDVPSDYFNDRDRRQDAFNHLLTLCKAWNKADNWEPDWKDKEQEKFYPVFGYNRYTVDVGQAVMGEIYTPFVFKTYERALQFGERFIDLFKQLYGIREGE